MKSVGVTGRVWVGGGEWPTHLGVPSFKQKKKNANPMRNANPVHKASPAAIAVAGMVIGPPRTRSQRDMT